MKQLYAHWNEQVAFFDVLVRQAHPGPAVPAYTSIEQKLQEAQTYQRDENLPWPVLVDDLAGTVHQVYGGLSDPTYLIDADGRVACYVMWTSVPVLYTAIEALLAQGGRGVVGRGLDRAVHPAHVLGAGWRGLERGLPQSAHDMRSAFPGSASLLWLTYQARPLHTALTQRAEPLPRPVRLLLGAGAALAVFALARRLVRG